MKEKTFIIVAIASMIALMLLMIQMRFTEFGLSLGSALNTFLIIVFGTMIY